MIKVNAIITLVFNSYLWLIQSQAQDMRVLYSSADINQKETTPRIKSIRGNSFSSFIFVRYEDGTKKRIRLDEVWGKIEKGIIYRRTGKNFLHIVNQQGLIEYAGMPIPYYNAVTKATFWRDGPHYYSKTLDSKMYGSPEEALRNTDLP